MSAQLRTNAARSGKKTRLNARAPHTPVDSGATQTTALEAGASVEAQVAEAAYYLAEQRGFEPGRKLEDWLIAEGQVTGRIGRSSLS